MKRKLLALVLAVSQLIALAVSVDAKDVEGYSYNFEDYTTNSNCGVLVATEIDTEGDVIDDKIEPSVITDSTGKSYGTSAKLTATEKNTHFNAAFGEELAKSYTNQYYMSIKYDLYTGDYNANKELQLKINGYGSTSHIVVATNGTLKLNNSMWYGSANLIPVNSWNNFEVRAYYGTNKIEYYLNNTYIYTAKLSADIERITGLKFVDYKGSTEASVMGLDNVEIKICDQYETAIAGLNNDFNTAYDFGTGAPTATLKSGIGYKEDDDKAVYTKGEETDVIQNMAQAAPALGEGYIYHMSFEWLMENWNSQKEFDIFVNGVTNNERILSFIHYNKDSGGAIKVNGAWPSFRPTAGEWNKYDLYFYCGTNKFELYIDETLIYTGTLDKTISSINGYRIINFKSTTETVMAVDNIKVEITKEGETEDNGNYLINNDFTAKSFSPLYAVINDGAEITYKKGNMFKGYYNYAMFLKLANGSINFQYVGNSYAITDNLVYEASIYSPQKGSTVYMQAALNSNTINSYLSMNDNGSITLNNAVVGTWTPERWYKFAIVYNKEAGTQDLYINGMLARENMKIADEITTLGRINLVYQAGSESICGFDDIKLYEGSYDAEKDKIIVIGNGVNDVDKVIYISEEKPAEDFINELIIAGKAKLYNSDKQTEADKAADTAVLVIKSQEGGTIDYYEIVDVTKRTFVGTIRALNANNQDISVAEAGTILATANIGTSGQKVTIFAAIYDETGKLTDVKMADKTVSAELKTTINITDPTKQSLKIMVWDSATLEPFTGSRSIAAAISK